MKLNLTVITYGLYVFLLGLFLFTVIVASTLIHINSKERCVQIEMRPVIPAAFVGNEDTLNQWAHVMAMGFIREVKHTERWSCNFCDKLSRETHINVLSWLHLPQPKLENHIYHLCEAGGGLCHQKAEATGGRIITQAGGSLPLSPQRLPKPAGVSDFPLAGSCAHCHLDHTANPNFIISRCGKCKLIRYCGPECQKEDWARHKSVCKTIKKVTWVNW